jgi:hypothetical protein
MFYFACDILAIPASTAPLERVFSVASQVLGNNRHSISDANLQKELFIRCNKIFLQN